MRRRVDPAVLIPTLTISLTNTPLNPLTPQSRTNFVQLAYALFRTNLDSNLSSIPQGCVAHQFDKLTLRFSERISITSEIHKPNLPFLSRYSFLSVCPSFSSFLLPVQVRQVQQPSNSLLSARLRKAHRLRSTANRGRV